MAIACGGLADTIAAVRRGYFDNHPIRIAFINVDNVGYPNDAWTKATNSASVSVLYALLHKADGRVGQDVKSSRSMCHSVSSTDLVP